MALVAVGLLFGAYAVGVRSGRAPVPAAAPAPAAAAEPSALYTLHLAEWPFSTAKERIRANMEVDEFIRSIRRAGHGQPEQVQIKRGDQVRMALYMGTFKRSDLEGDAVLGKLKAIRRLKVGTDYPFHESGFVKKPQ